MERITLTNCHLRPFRFTGGMVRMVVPSGIIGAYALFRVLSGSLSVVYVGRSDTDLRRRLLSHPYRALAAYFSYEPCASASAACLAERRAYGRFRPPLNRLFPASVAAAYPELHRVEWPVPRSRADAG